MPNAANCLLSGTRFDKGGGTFIGGNGKCILKDKKGKVVGKGNKVGRLYLMDTCSQLLGQAPTNFSTMTHKQSWDQWHKNFGHMVTLSLEHLHQEKGMAVDQSSIPSRSCKTCIQAKQACRSYPQEAEHRS